MVINYRVEMNFYEDWIEHLKEKLFSLGYGVSSTEKPQDISIKFFNLLKRIVDPVPRKVLVAKEFSYPPEYDQIVKEIQEKVEKGQDLSPHLSKKLMDLDYDDPMLNDWGIHHLHLGNTTDGSGFVNRTGLLLFVRFEMEKAFFINVMPHGSWTKQNIITIIHNNWPDSIKMYRLNGIISLEPKISDSDISKLRRAGVQTFVQIDDGVIYAPIGGGYASSGTSVEVVRTSDYYAKRIRSLEKTIIDNLDNLIVDAAAKGVSLGEHLEFKLEFFTEQVIAVEKNSGLNVKLGSL